MREVIINGERWQRTPERRCVHCGTRTYRISRRVGNELIVESDPGPYGSVTFVRPDPCRERLFALCTRCFKNVFLSDRTRVIAWDSRRVDRTTD